VAGDRSRGDASRRDSESPRREGRRQDRLGPVLGSMLGSAQSVNTNPGSQKAKKSMNQRPADRFGGCTHPPVERHSVVVPSPGPTFEIRRTLRRMAAGFAESPGLERFSFVLRTSWAWAGSTIPQAPKERRFIAWGRQPQDPETRQEKPFPAPTFQTYVRIVGATGASRGRALLSPRLGLGTGKSRGRLGTSWGLRLQAMNCRRCAAGEKSLDIAECDLVGGDEANGIIRAQDLRGKALDEAVEP